MASRSASRGCVNGSLGLVMTRLLVIASQKINVTPHHSAYHCGALGPYCPVVQVDSGRNDSNLIVQELSRVQGLSERYLGEGFG